MSSPLMYHHLLCLHSLCPHLSCFSQVLKKGVFHPMTMSGNLVVDGVLVSIFTDLVPVVASVYHSSPPAPQNGAPGGSREVEREADALPSKIRCCRSDPSPRPPYLPPYLPPFPLLHSLPPSLLTTRRLRAMSSLQYCGWPTSSACLSSPTCAIQASRSCTASSRHVPTRSSTS